MASITRCRFPGRCTITSGRSFPSAVANDCSRSKSQYWAMPDNSMTFFRVSSPHLPLVFGLARRAFTKFFVSSLTPIWVLITFSNSWLMFPYASCLFDSIAARLCLYSFKVSETGSSKFLMAFSFLSFSDCTTF